MADNRLSEKFDALSDKAKESANKLNGLTPVGWPRAYESLAAHVVGRKARQDYGDEEAAHPGAGCAQVDGGGSAVGRG